MSTMQRLRTTHSQIRSPYARTTAVMVLAVALYGLHARFSQQIEGFGWTPSQLNGRLLLSLQPLDESFSAPAAIHGWVNKSGIVDLRQWHADFKSSRAAEFVNWLKDWEQDDSTQTDPPPTVLARCQIFVNHRYKFLYVRHTKTGSSSLLDYLTECGAEDAGPACLERVPMEVSIPKVERMWRDYFVFTVVRNPYLRALSSYKFLLSRMDANHTCSQNYTWEDFCFDPMSLGHRCHPESCCHGGPSMFWGHTAGQDRCLLAAPSDGAGEEDVGDTLPPTNPPAWAVDYIARTERMAEDTVEILAEIDRRRDPGLPPLSRAAENEDGPRVVNNRTLCAEGDSDRIEPKRWLKPEGAYYGAVPQEQYCNTDEYFGKRHEGCSAALHHFFKRDFQLLYPTEAVGQSSLER